MNEQMTSSSELVQSHFHVRIPLQEKYKYISHAFQNNKQTTMLETDLDAKLRVWFQLLCDLTLSTEKTLC
jgi:hypothetical protein